MKSGREKNEFLSSVYRHRQKVILTSYDSIEHPELLNKLRSKGIAKFIAYEMSLESTRFNYREVFDIAYNVLNESDDLKILVSSDESSLRKFSFDELSNPAFYEPDQAQTLDIYMVDV